MPSEQTTVLTSLLEQSAALHRHLCPRQVLGARMGLLAGKLLGLSLPRQDKRLLVWVETDGCFADGVSVATGCWLGRRTLRLMDQGKVAATFTDTHSNRSIRIAPHKDARKLALDAAPHSSGKWQAYLESYQRLSDETLFVVSEVELLIPWQTTVSSKRHRVICASCFEEIINGREVRHDQLVLCRQCAGTGYLSRGDT